VIANCQPKRLLLQVADHSGLWPRIAGGSHPARDTTAAIQRSGFEIHTIERIMFAVSRLEPSIPHILGTAAGESCPTSAGRTYVRARLRLPGLLFEAPILPLETARACSSAAPTTTSSMSLKLISASVVIAWMMRPFIRASSCQA
jgi:hypothetical protein